MYKVIELYKSSKFLFFGLLLLITFAIVYRVQFFPNADKVVRDFEAIFQSHAELLESRIDDFSNTINYGDELKVIWENTRKFRNTGFDYYVFENDSLIYWTSNNAPLDFKAISHTNKGTYLLRNGWYYLSTRQDKNVKIVGLFLIKHQFPYENESLRNIFNPDFGMHYRAQISNSSDAYSIHYSNGDFAFSMSDLTRADFSSWQELLIFLVFILGLLFFLLGLHVGLLRRMPKRESLVAIISILVVILTKFTLSIFNWQDLFPGFGLFNPKLLASSECAPNLGDLVLNTSLLLILLLNIKSIWNVNKRLVNKKYQQLIALAAFFVFGVMSYLLIILTTIVIRDSDVPLSLYNFMSLNAYSFLFVLLFFMYLWMYFHSSILLLHCCEQAFKKNQKILFFLACFSIVFFIISFFYFDFFWIEAIFPICFSAVIFYISPWKKGWAFNFRQVISLLVLFSIFFAIQLNLHLNQKEIESRAIYAKKLISEKVLETEIEYASLQQDLNTLPLLQNFLIDPDPGLLSTVTSALKGYFFSGYWDRYDFDFYFYHADTVAVSSFYQVNKDPAKNFNQIIQASGVQSELTQHLYYVSDYAEGLSYIARQPIFHATEDTLLGYVYMGIRSKVIPQELGFPRLLINENSKVFFQLEEYDMAKYVSGKLVKRFGSYNYPRSIGSFLIDFSNKSGLLSDKGYSHQVTHGDRNKTIILSKPEVGITQYLTTFSFLFTSYGTVILWLLLFSGKLIPNWGKIKLAFRIQLIFILLVFFSLLFSGIATGSHVKRQYTQYQEGLLQEKVSSVQKELYSKLEFEESLDDEQVSNYIDHLLRKFSSVFVTDINLYDHRGQLIASSRPEIFNLGLLSQQINPRAYRQMYHRELSLYVNQEFIGMQKYFSSYVPLLNGKGVVLGYINLPYFAKQNEFENEIAGFLSAIINIFVILLALSIVVAVIITGRIVEPLKKIQGSLQRLKLGSAQRPIAYRGNDEIGFLVFEYNKKLEELQVSSEKLAKSEREMAWREMAKQVAHEIKNPLTPMKLRIQHFQRSFDPNAAEAPEKIQQFSDALIEQIESLTNIANAFSNFAKMPRVQFEVVDLCKIVNSAVDTFVGDAHIEIFSKLPNSPQMVKADKELILRVCNNLIKNAIQAIPSGKPGEVHVELKEKTEFLELYVRDNGSGVSDEMKDRIFFPNFTTKSTGTGLGLAMVKQIIESHDGRIDFESQPGRTIFKVVLPKQIK